MAKEGLVKRTPEWVVHFALYLGSGLVIFLVTLMFANQCYGRPL